MLTTKLLETKFLTSFSSSYFFLELTGEKNLPLRDSHIGATPKIPKTQNTERPERLTADRVAHFPERRKRCS